MPSSSYSTLVSFSETFFSLSVASASPFPIFISFCERAGPTALLRISFSSSSSFILLLWSYTIPSGPSMKFDASLKNVPRASSYVCNTSSNADLLTSMILVTFKFFCDSPAFSSLASVSTMTVPSSILISLTRSRPIFSSRLPRSTVNCLFSLLSLSILSS